MHLHPQLRALRSDDAPQRHAQGAHFKALENWRASPDVAAVQSGLADYAAGHPLADCPALAGLFAGDQPAAPAFVRYFMATGCAALKEAPLGHVPLRHFTDGTISTLLLARSGGASLLLVALDGASLAARPAPLSASFSSTQAHEFVLAGAAAAQLVSAPDAPAVGAPLRRQPLSLLPGVMIARDARREALLVERIAGRLVTLRLQRRCAEDTAPTCEYDLATGRLLHQAAGNVRESRQELMMALLGRMGRADAAPVLSAMARENGPAALRWQALRECLALDTLTGFQTLGALARRADDDLAVAAGALHAQLIEHYPELAGIAPCPAY